MIYPLSERAPGASNLTAKNRVWGFFENSNRTRPANRRKPPELRRKIRLTPTKTASGIPYWPSRDPIGERGGINLYGFVGNNGVNWVDICGRIALKQKATICKCHLARGQQCVEVEIADLEEVGEGDPVTVCYDCGLTVSPLSSEATNLDAKKALSDAIQELNQKFLKECQLNREFCEPDIPASALNCKCNIEGSIDMPDR